MASRETNEPQGPDARGEQLLARREDQRRRRARRRQRRLLGLSAVCVAIAVAAGVVLLAGGNSGPGRGNIAAGIDPAPVDAPRAGSGGSESAFGPVRNATPQPGWRPYAGPVPILEYHVLGKPEGEVPYPELYVSRPDFRRQLEWLDENGYQAVTLEQVEEAWFEGGTLPPKPVVLSFDDGYRPQFTFALPQLRRHGWAGVLNLKAEGSDLYESNVKAMIAAGWELAAHTIHHLDLTELDSAQLTEEVAGSREILRREYGVPVKNFCYPAGQFDETVIAAVEAAGYVGATTEIPGYATSESPYELARFEILGDSGVSGLAEDLRTGEGQTGEVGA
jgi:peptidoglycan/xylan/chitin deacetylase (PgdA/CDA1 family)